MVGSPRSARSVMATGRLSARSAEAAGKASTLSVDATCAVEPVLWNALSVKGRAMQRARETTIVRWLDKNGILRENSFDRPGPAHMFARGVRLSGYKAHIERHLNILEDTNESSVDQNRQ